MAEPSGVTGSLILGEVHTALLQSSAPVPPAAGERLVSLLIGERVSRFERPIDHVRSPDLTTGVDCRLAASSGVSPRAIGTVIGNVSITGGHVVQAATRVRVVPGAASQRQTWQYYLARCGVAEIVGKRPAWEDLASGFVLDGSPDSGIDLGGIAARLLDQVQVSARLDRRAPFPARRTKLRWAALATDREVARPLRFQVERDELRTLVGWVPPGQLHRIAEFSEDLALHDWLLTTLQHLLRRSRLGVDDRAHAVAKLGPAVEYLLHLWMPAARLDETAAGLWRGLERRPGLGRQWQTAVDRIRDQLALHTIAMLNQRADAVVDHRVVKP